MVRQARPGGKGFIAFRGLFPWATAGVSWSRRVVKEIVWVSCGCAADSLTGPGGPSHRFRSTSRQVAKNAKKTRSDQRGVVKHEGPRGRTRMQGRRMRRPPRGQGPGPGKRDRRFRDEKRVGNREIREIREREDQAGRRLRRATRGQPPATPDGANGSAHTEARSHEVKTNRHPSDPCGFVALCEIPFLPGVPLRLLDLRTCPCHAPPVRLQYLPRDTRGRTTNESVLEAGC